MLKTINLGLQFGGRKLFDDVNINFTKGNCYGIIGANGAGKSTFLKILSGEIQSTAGSVILEKNTRMSVLKQNQNAYDDYSAIKTVLLGHADLVRIMEEREAIYAKPDFNEADGLKAAELEGDFAEMNGWEAESDAATLLHGLGVKEQYHDVLMADLDPKIKVKVLLAQSLFGNPDILLLDEPTNNLDAMSARWLENFLMNFDNTVLVVSHDRHFLNRVCTHICDVDFGKIDIYQGNYEFWYETSQLAQKQAKDQNKKSEQKIKELEEFIARFSANLSKSKQATSRKRALDKIVLNDIKPSNRKYPFIDFKPSREVGKEILEVKNLTKKGFFENISFTVSKDDKICFLSDNSLSITMLFNCLAGIEKADSGEFKWGVTVTQDYLISDNKEYFQKDINLIDWVRQWSKDDQTETFIRGWLGRMLFSQEESLKKANVLSGGEKVRCMLTKVMLSYANVILLDDPTNHLDLEAIQALNQGMIRFKGNLLFTSHDTELINTVANRIIVIKDTVVYDKLISYEDYLENLERKENKK
ncbi:MAG: ATP-binding cassette domain-containing protein [Erysipelotrichales bacterium]|nr:ATP-binding cassette domain-containing protein [Erysipelotrichales bacterium]